MLASVDPIEASRRGVFLDRMFRSDYSWLVSRVHRHSARTADPEDVASETFVQMLGLPGLLELRDTRAMLVTIAKRLLWRISRKRAIEEAYIVELGLSEGLVQPSDDSRLEAISVLAAIDEALEQGSAKARRAFVYWYIDGMTHAAIAEELGVSVSMVRKYLAQSLLACHAVLSAE